MDVVRQPTQGWIEVIVGSMFSGKSEELIRRLRRAQIARQKVQIFKPAVDTRFDDDQIVSHSEMRIESCTVVSSRDLLDRVAADTEVIGIDEGQFFECELPCSIGPYTASYPAVKISTSPISDTGRNATAASANRMMRPDHFALVTFCTAAKATLPPASPVK